MLETRLIFITFKITVYLTPDILHYVYTSLDNFNLIQKKAAKLFSRDCIEKLNVK